MTTRRRLALFAFLSIAVFLTSETSGQRPPDARDGVWAGVAYNVDSGLRDTAGIRVTALPSGSPAEKAGVLIGDVIVAIDGRPFDADPAGRDRQFREAVSVHAAGDPITLRVLRASEVTDIPVRLEHRPLGVGLKEYSSDASIQQVFPRVSWPEEKLANKLIADFNIAGAYNDLRRRLARLSNTGDRFRLSRAAYIQHDPFQLRTVAGSSLDRVSTVMRQKQPDVILRQAADWLDSPVAAAPPLKTGLSLDEHLDQLVRVLMDAQAKRREAFAELSADDQRFLETNCDALFALFSEQIDIQQDPDRERLRRNMRLLELVARVDFVKLFEGAELLWRVSEDDYLNDLESAIRRAWEQAGKPEGIFVNRDSPAGKIVVGGNGSTWYRDDAAILLDLGGNDFYTNNAGSSRGSAMPAALLIDFAGDDAYESTVDWSQSAARMGYGLLIDRKGNDNYIGRQWDQAAAVLGAALLLDEGGNDIYRADQFAQGAAAWGIAVHLDYGGDDIYDAHQLAQGVGLPGGAGWLLDANGNDRYYAKGTRPTNYGDAGIFDSWSQGSAIGFRGLQSGGVGVLLDGGGKDRYEAGNFSQGGGYYFGVGMLRDEGNADDTYIGSRYNQGFAAHQAIGYFEEMGGNDLYTTRQAVAQGISWDETIAMFIDHSGDDVYEGGAFYSQGASAHNGFCIFLDLGGRNRFVYSMPQASSGPNDYHGGFSFSLFVGAEDHGNVYTSGMKPSSIHMQGEYGLFVDLTTSIEAALKKETAHTLRRPVWARSTKV